MAQALLRVLLDLSDNEDSLPCFECLMHEAKVKGIQVYPDDFYHLYPLFNHGGTEIATAVHRLLSTAGNEAIDSGEVKGTAIVTPAMGMQESVGVLLQVPRTRRRAVMKRGKLVDAIWELIEDYCPEKTKTKIMLGKMLDCLFLFSRKQHDYSSLNIALGGARGVFYRALDKMMRLWSHNVLGKEVLNEGINDTWSDLAVYSLIALMVRHGEWQPTSEELVAMGMEPAMAIPDILSSYTRTE